MYSSDNDPNTLSSPVYSSSQSQVKYVRQNGPIPAELVLHPSDDQVSQPEDHQPQQQHDIHAGSNFAIERLQLQSFFNTMDKLGFALRGLTHTDPNNSRHQAMRVRL